MSNKRRLIMIDTIISSADDDREVKTTLVRYFWSAAKLKIWSGWRLKLRVGEG